MSTDAVRISLSINHLVCRILFARGSWSKNEKNEQIRIESNGKVNKKYSMRIESVGGAKTIKSIDVINYTLYF